MKVAIVIITYNIPSEIFILQIQAIRKLCKDDFTIQIFDNSTKEDMAEAIRYHSELLGIKYRKTNPSVGEGSLSHSWSSNLSYQTLKDEYDYFFYLDHDCIPVVNFSVVEILEDKLYAGIAQKTPTYLWPGCFMFNNNAIDHNLIDFTPNHTLGLDTGGELFHLVDKYGKEMGVFFKENYCQNQHFNHKLYNHYAMIQDTFMHFIAASNWISIEHHTERINGLIAILKEKTNL